MALGQKRKKLKEATITQEEGGLVFRHVAQGVLSGCIPSFCEARSLGPALSSEKQRLRVQGVIGNDSYEGIKGK